MFGLEVGAQEVDEFVQFEQPHFGDDQLRQILERVAGEEAKHVVRLVAVGIKDARQGSGTDAGEDVGADAVLQQGLHDAQVGKTLDEAPAQGEACRVFISEIVVGSRFHKHVFYRARS